MLRKRKRPPHRSSQSNHKPETGDSGPEASKHGPAGRGFCLTECDPAIWAASGPGHCLQLTRSYLNLLLQGKLPLQAALHHLCGHRQIFWQLQTALDHHRVAAVQELVAKHEVFLPVIHDPLCRERTAAQPELWAGLRSSWCRPRARVPAGTLSQAFTAQPTMPNCLTTQSGQGTIPSSLS